QPPAFTADDPTTTRSRHRLTTDLGLGTDRLATEAALTGHAAGSLPWFGDDTASPALERGAPKSAPRARVDTANPAQERGAPKSAALPPGRVASGPPPPSPVLPPLLIDVTPLTLA